MIGYNFHQRSRELFGPTCDADTVSRAALFLSEAFRTLARDWANPFDQFLLSVEPFHPYRPEDVPHRLGALGYPDAVTELFSKCGMTLLNLPLLQAYSEMVPVPSVYETMLRASQSPNGDYLLDPLYGFVFWREGNRYRNTIVSPEEIIRWEQANQQLGDLFWQNPSELLSQGSMAAAYLFGNHFDSRVKAAYGSREVPEIVVTTEGEFHTLVQTLSRLSADAPQVELWYRGQNHDYLVPDRMPLFDAGLVPYGDVTDSSLVPSLYRNIDKSCETVEDYRSLIETVEWWRNSVAPSLALPFTSRRPGEEPQELAPDLPGPEMSSRIVHESQNGDVISDEIKDFHWGLDSVQHGLLLQHYGCPTGWIDITSDPAIALWFAVHHLRTDAGLTYCRRHSWSGGAPSEWPTVYVFALDRRVHPYLNTHTLLQRTSALRPLRQECGLLGAAGNLARNFPARYITLKIRIAPALTTSDGLEPEYLFPGPSEDECLAVLLTQEEERRARRSDLPFLVYRLADH